MYEDIDEVAVLIDGAPQVSTFALDVHDHLVEEPPIAAWSLVFLDTPRVLGAEGLALLSIRFTGNAYPTSAKRFSISRKLKVNR